MNGSVKLVVDAMGGDNAPGVVLEGVEAALASDDSLDILLCGAVDVVEPFCAVHDRCEPVVASEVIGMGEHPAHAIRKKKDSSIVVGCSQVRNGAAQGFFSAGSTGACLAAATMVIGRIKGVKRPALAVIVPTYGKPTLLLDVGANADCKPEYLVQFAQMGSIFSRNIMGVSSPKVGLLNIGKEDAKGSILAQKANHLLGSKLADFAGNCEGGDLMMGEFDVVVTDGFTGNVALKTMEGTSKLLLKYVKGVFTSSAKTKLGAALVLKDMKELKQKIDPNAIGGSPLLGVKGACIVGHGSSNAEAIKSGIFATSDIIRKDVSGQIERNLFSGRSDELVENAETAAQAEGDAAISVGTVEDS